MSELWYFTYGSNLDPDRFRRRVGDWSERRAAVLEGWRLRFSGDVQSEGGGGAIIEQAEGDRVFGAVLRIDADQIRTMDDVELSSERNRENRGVRRQVEVATDRGSVQAEVYMVEGNRTYRAPSDTYLDHILRGLEAVGHGPEVCEEIRAIAAGEPSG